DAAEPRLLRSDHLAKHAAGVVGVPSRSAGSRRLHLSDVRRRRAGAGESDRRTTPRRRHPHSRQVELGGAGGAGEAVKWVDGWTGGQVDGVTDGRQFSRLPVYRSTGLPVYRSTGLPVYRSTGLPVYRSTGPPSTSENSDPPRRSSAESLRR